MASERQEKDWWQTCTFFGAFIELRYGDSENIPVGDERIAHDLYCLCGSIDGDGMNCLLGQPQKKRSAMCRSARKLGLVRLAENAEEAAAALRKSQLSRNRKQDR